MSHPARAPAGRIVGALEAFTGTPAPAAQWMPPLADQVAYIRSRWPTRAAMEADETDSPCIGITGEARRVAWESDPAKWATMPEKDHPDREHESVSGEHESVKAPLTDSVRVLSLSSSSSRISSSPVDTPDTQSAGAPAGVTFNGVPVQHVDSLPIADASPRTTAAEARLAGIEALAQSQRVRAMRASVRESFRRLLSSLAVASLCGLPLRVSLSNTRKAGTTSVRPEHVRLLVDAGAVRIVSEGRRGGSAASAKQTRITLSPEFTAGLSLTDFDYPGIVEEPP